MLKTFEGYTVKEVAAMFKVSEKTIQNYIRSGMLQGVKFGNRWRFFAEDIEAFLTKMRKKQQGRHLNV